MIEWDQQGIMDGDGNSLVITFDNETSTEERYDYITFYMDSECTEMVPGSLENKGGAVPLLRNHVNGANILPHDASLPLILNQIFQVDNGYHTE